MWAWMCAKDTYMCNYVWGYTWDPLPPKESPAKTRAQDCQFPHVRPILACRDFGCRWPISNSKRPNCGDGFFEPLREVSGPENLSSHACFLIHPSHSTSFRSSFQFPPLKFPSLLVFSILVVWLLEGFHMRRSFASWGLDRGWLVSLRGFSRPAPLCSRFRF